MKKKTLLFLMVSLFTVVGFYAAEADALGLGGYLTLGTGSAEGEIDRDPGTFDTGHDVSPGGFGFVLDTRVASDGLFNYRLNVGYEIVGYDDTTANSLDTTFLRFSIDNTFGFAVFKNEKVRVYLGPQVRLAYMIASETTASEGDLGILALGIGLAPVAGVNVHLNDKVSLSFETGYRFTSYVGTLELDRANQSYTWTNTEKALFFNVSVFYRINDVF